MAGVTLTTADKLLKDIYAPGLRNWINHRRPLWGRLQNLTKEDFEGRQLLIGVQYGNNQSTGGVGEGEALPPGGSNLYAQMAITPKYHYSVCRMTRQAMDAAISSRGGFAKSITAELDGTRDQLEEELAISSTFGDGSGAIGKISTTATGTTATLYGQPTVGQMGSRAVRVGQYVQSWASKTTGAVGAAHIVVATVPTSTTFTTASTTWTANEYLFRSVTTSVDPRNRVMMGLGGLVDDGTRVGTFQGLSRTTYPSLKANILGASGVLRPISQDLFDAACQESWLNGGGQYPTAAYSPLEIQRRMASYLKADRHFDMTTKTYDGGYAGIEWTFPGGKLDWFVDRYCIPNEVHLVRESDMFMLEQEPIGFEETDGKMWRYTDRTHAVEAWMYTWLNLGARACNNFTALQDISHTA